MTLSGFSSSLNTLTSATEHTGDATLTSGTATFGAYVQVNASIGITYNYLLIMVDDPNTSNDYVFNIAIGASGSEVDINDEILYHQDLTGNSQITGIYPIKLRIPVGSRITARVSATNNTDTITVHLLGQGF